MKACTLFIFLLVLPAICFAQMNSQSTVHTPRGYVEPYDLNLYKEVVTQREQAYQQNFQAIDNQLEALRLRLDDLNATDSEAAAKIIPSYNDYLTKLSQARIDWSLTDNYRTVANTIRQFNNMVTEAYNNLRYRRTPSQPEFTQPRSTDEDNINRRAEAILYASIYQKPDGEKIVHMVDKQELVTILGVSGGYYYVRCGKYEGYLSKGMIKQFIR